MSFLPSSTVFLDPRRTNRSLGTASNALLKNLLDYLIGLFTSIVMLLSKQPVNVKACSERALTFFSQSVSWPGHPASGSRSVGWLCECVYMFPSLCVACQGHGISLVMEGSKKANACKAYV